MAGTANHRVAVIGYGAMAGYVARQLAGSPWELCACVIRAGRESAARAVMGDGPDLVFGAGDFAVFPDLVVDCAGHAGLHAHGGAFLQRGVPVISASLGALADADMYDALQRAATAGGTQLMLASGAIGALDALSAARIGGLDRVAYTGTKPAAGWRGTPAETAGDREALTQPLVHFDGTARQAALSYPKNANVAAAVALAGVGFDATRARLIADPTATGNTHHIAAEGAFGAFEFTITGVSLPDTPRTSALAAMSVVDRILRQSAPIVL